MGGCLLQEVTCGAERVLQSIFSANHLSLTSEVVPLATHVEGPRVVLPPGLALLQGGLGNQDYRLHNESPELVVCRMTSSKAVPGGRSPDNTSSHGGDIPARD